MKKFKSKDDSIKQTERCSNCKNKRLPRNDAERYSANNPGAMICDILGCVVYDDWPCVAAD